LGGAIGAGALMAAVEMGRAPIASGILVLDYLGADDRRRSKP